MSDSTSATLANGSYTVLTSTNVAVPLSSWNVALTNQFDAGGQFTLTNAVSLPEAPRFFRLLIP